MQLLGLERVLQANTTEQFRCEIGDAGKFHIFTTSESIPQLDGAVVVKADNIAGERLSRMLPVACHEGQRIGKTNLFADPHMTRFHALIVTP